MKKIYLNLRSKINLPAWGKAAPALAGVQSEEQLDVIQSDLEIDPQLLTDDLSPTPQSPSITRSQDFLSRLSLRKPSLKFLAPNMESGFIVSKKILIGISLMILILIGILGYILI